MIFTFDFEAEVIHEIFLRETDLLFLVKLAHAFIEKLKDRI